MNMLRYFAIIVFMYFLLIKFTGDSGWWKVLLLLFVGVSIYYEIYYCLQGDIRFFTYGLAELIVVLVTLIIKL